MFVRASLTFILLHLIDFMLSCRLFFASLRIFAFSTIFCRLLDATLQILLWCLLSLNQLLVFCTLGFCSLVLHLGLQFAQQFLKLSWVAYFIKLLELGHAINSILKEGTVQDRILKHSVEKQWPYEIVIHVDRLVHDSRILIRLLQVCWMGCGHARVVEWVDGGLWCLV